VLDDLFSYQVYNKIKDHWRAATAPADIQAGMIYSDSDDNKVYHYGAAAKELVQDGITQNFTVPDAGTIGLGAGKGLIQFDDEATDLVSFQNCSVLINATAAVGTEKLLVAGDIMINGNQKLIFRNTGAGLAAGAISFQHHDGTQKSAIASYYNVADEGDIEFLVGTATKMMLTSTGSVLIGATAAVGSELFRCDGNAYFDHDVSALTFTDRTPLYEGDALAELLKIKGVNGQIDHATLPLFAQVRKMRNTYEDRSVTRKRPKTITKQKQESVEEIKLIKGRYTKVVSFRTVEVEEPVYELYDLYDKAGKKILGPKGNPAQHQVPVMEQYQDTERVKTGEEEYTERNLGAMISMLIVAVQQLSAEVDALKAAR